MCVYVYSQKIIVLNASFGKETSIRDGGGRGKRHTVLPFKTDWEISLTSILLNRRYIESSWARGALPGNLISVTVNATAMEMLLLLLLRHACATYLLWNAFRSLHARFAFACKLLDFFFLQRLCLLYAWIWEIFHISRGRVSVRKVVNIVRF